MLVEIDKGHELSRYKSETDREKDWEGLHMHVNSLTWGILFPMFLFSKDI
jgi:hypothetical protein